MGGQDEAVSDALETLGPAAPQFPNWRPADAAQEEKWNAALGSMLRELPVFRRDCWVTLSDATRVDILQAVEILLAANQGRAPAHVVTARLPWGTDGQYLPKENQIELHQRLIAKPGACLRTLLHESRHAYQRHAQHVPGTHYSARAVRRWEAGSLMKLVPGLYVVNPKETDAFRHAAHVMSAAGMGRVHELLGLD